MPSLSEKLNESGVEWKCRKEGKEVILRVVSSLTL